MRIFTVSNVGHEITDKKAEELLDSGALYPCGDGHDLHLSPDHDFTLGEVETLLRSNE